MRLAFLILAHDRPGQTLELARTLVAAASDGVAIIHYDSRSPEADFRVLEEAAAAEPRIRLVGNRVACRWGSFGLVEAPLNAMKEIEAADLDPAYVILLSGACLPCRPVAALERYLAENAGREFIEVADASWVSNGWRDERWKYRFWFDHKTQEIAERVSFKVQRLLGLTRSFPKGLTPRFGSQWWALTWDTCRAMLLDMARDPARLDFFRTVWIPDEMVIQTWVNALVSPGEIAGHGLTHFQFTNRGKPIVFHDDHMDYVSTLDSFFVRKISPGAADLRVACLASAGAPDDGAPFALAGPRRADYRLKVMAQTWYPVPGQIFYRDQQTDMTDSVLATAHTPYVVVVGPPALTRAAMAAIPGGGFTRLGEVFDPAEADLGHEDDGSPRFELDGLTRGDRAIRDLHPALFLTRLRERCPAVPLLTWSPFNAPDLLEAVLRDPQGLVIACLPFTGDAVRDRRLAALVACQDPAVTQVPESTFAGLDPVRASRARIDGLGGLDGSLPGSGLFYGTEDGARCALVALPWAPMGSLNAQQRRRMFEESLGNCRFVSAHWFRGLARGLRQVWAERFESDAEALLGPMPAGAAALFASGGRAPDDAPEAPPELMVRQLVSEGRR